MRNKRRLGILRGIAVLLGLAVLGWQAVNAVQGRFLHEFVIPDFVLGAGLIAAGRLRDDARAAAAMLALFAALGGVFLSATGMRLLAGGYNLGTALTTLGLIPCAGASWVLGRWLSDRAD